MTKNRTPTPVYLDPGMHPGLEVKGLITCFYITYKYEQNCLLNKFLVCISIVNNHSYITITQQQQGFFFIYIY